MSINTRLLLALGAVALPAGTAAAQPLPPSLPLPTPAPTPAPAPTTAPTAGAPTPTPPSPPPTPTPSPSPSPYPPEPDQAALPEGWPVPVTATTSPEVPADAGSTPAPPAAPIELPELLLAPTGTILPAAILYSRSGIDTSGGLSSDLRFGLGNVAEFGVAATDLVRARAAHGASLERVQPMLTATFRMGLAADRLFRHQPALTLGYRKSFEYEAEGHRIRIAELHLAASSHLGARATVHVNGSLWDASVETNDAGAVLLHDQGLGRQLRAGGGVAVRAVDDSDVVIDLAWTPELCYACTAPNQIRLRPILSWGVRYNLAPWAQLQSGVRVPDIGDANLLDAQIFGQLTLVSRAVERLIGRSD